MFKKIIILSFLIISPIQAKNILDPAVGGKTHPVEQSNQKAGISIPKTEESLKGKLEPNGGAARNAISLGLSPGWAAVESAWGQAWLIGFFTLPKPISQVWPRYYW